MDSCQKAGGKVWVGVGVLVAGVFVSVGVLVTAMLVLVKVGVVV